MMLFLDWVLSRRLLRCLVLLTSGLLVPVLSSAQRPTYRSRVTDSLRAELGRAGQPDSQRVLTLFSLEQEYYGNDDVTSLRVAQQALALARRRGFVRGELMVLSDLARTAAETQDLPQAERWAQELQRRAWAAPPALSRFRIVALQTLAAVAGEQGDTQRALRYLRQSLPLLVLVANRPGSDFPLISYHSLNTMYTSRAVGLSPPADSLVRLARFYARHTVALARSYTTRFAHVRGGPDRRDILAAAYSSLGQLSEATGSDSAAYYFRQSARLQHILRVGADESHTYALWATAELHHQRYHPALALAHRAVALAQTVRVASVEVEARDVLAEVLAAVKQPAAAYQQARRARQLHDSLVQVNNLARLQTLQVRFDTQRQESQIRNLTQQQLAEREQARRQQQQLWWLGTGLVVVAGAGATVGLLALRLRRSRALLAAQNEELTQTRAAQDRLYALVAHDLRSPVVAFAGLAELLHRYVQRQDTDRLAGLGERIRQAAHNLHELLDNLLNWAISQRGELVPALRPLRVPKLLAEIAELYCAAATAAEIDLVVEVPGDLVVEADLDMTRTILRNLLGNALKATPPGGKVTLQAWCQADEVQLQIANTGRGLAPEVLAQLAAGPHLRVAGQNRGAGLGLLLSRSFAQAQGGTLTLANAVGGEGIVARLALPAADQGTLGRK